MTLSDLLAILRLGLAAGGPAIGRLPERTVEALATVYLARDLWCRWSPTEPGVKRRSVREVLAQLPFDGDPEFEDTFRLIDLSDPGTAQAVLVALALSYGHDPGMLGLDVALRRDDDGWTLYTASGWEYGGSGAERGLLHIPASEPAAAIAAMVAHRLAA